MNILSLIIIHLIKNKLPFRAPKNQKNKKIELDFICHPFDFGAQKQCEKGVES